MDISWEDIRLFLAAAETGSMSGAARKLNIGQPTVSRRLADLEHRLGAALFRRSVEGVILTDAGERLLDPARRMADWAGEVGRAAERTDDGPSGKVRVSAPPYLAVDLLAPLAGWLAVEAPGLRLEVSASVEYASLGRGEADLALRGREADRPDLCTVFSVEHGVGVFASPELVARLGPSPALAEIPWIAWCAPFEHVPPNPQLRQLLPNVAPAFTTDDFLVMLAAAEAGAGALALSTLRHRLSPPRRLVQLEVDLGPLAKGTLHLVCARSALAIPRIRAVADHIAEALQRACA